MKNNHDEYVKEALNAYRSYDAKTDEFIASLRKEGPDNGDQFDLKLSGCGLAILSEATLALRNAHLMMRATRMNDGKERKKSQEQSITSPD